jgi:hypothetical protein
MKTSLLITCAALVAFVQTSLAETFYVFKVRASVPVVIIETGTNKDTTVRKTLANNDVINLTLGRPLTTPVKSKEEVLALATTFEDHSSPPTPNPVSKLIIWNPSTNPGSVTAVVATLTSLDFDTAYGGARQSGQGVGSVKVLATTKGDPSKNGFLESALDGSGMCAGPHIKYTPGTFTPKSVSPVGSGTIVGKLEFTLTDSKGTTKTMTGYVLRGTLTLSGNAIGTFDEP